MTADWHIRPAAKRDAGLLSEIDASASAHSLSTGQLLSGCDPDKPSEDILIIEEAKLPVGFVVFNRVLDEGSIHNIVVQPSHQRRGLARALLTAAMQAMREDGVSRCLLEVQESNVSARHLYVDMGFELDGRRKNYYLSGDGREDALLMSRLL